MLKKKTTVVIDHQAEEQAKQQAMQAELDALKPKAKSPVAQLQDTSVETNRSSLKKIKKSTLKTIGLVVLACAIISLLTWSILHKNYLDQQEKDHQTKLTERRVALKAIDDVMLGSNQKTADECESTQDEQKQDCQALKQYDAIHQVLTQHKDKLPDEKKSQALTQQVILLSQVSDYEQRHKRLNDLSGQFEEFEADHRAYFELSNAYIIFDKAVALQHLRKSKELYERQLKEAAEPDYERYNYDANIKSLEAAITEARELP